MCRCLATSAATVPAMATTRVARGRMEQTRWKVPQTCTLRHSNSGSCGRDRNGGIGGGAESSVDGDELPHTHPQKQRCGRTHGINTLMCCTQLLCRSHRRRRIACGGHSSLPRPRTAGPRQSTYTQRRSARFGNSCGRLLIACLSQSVRSYE